MFWAQCTHLGRDACSFAFHAFTSTDRGMNLLLGAMSPSLWLCSYVGACRIFLTVYAQILPYTTERELRNCFAHRDIFNDTSLHSFLKNDATSVADAANEMWSDVAEPSYDGTDHGNEIVWTEEKPTLMT